MAAFLIPITTGQPQTLSVSLSGTQYNISLNYRQAGGVGWVLDIADSIGNPIVSGVPLVQGAYLLQQYRYLFPFGDLLLLQSGTPPAGGLTFQNLGTDFNLYWITL